MLNKNLLNEYKREKKAEPVSWRFQSRVCNVQWPEVKLRLPTHLVGTQSSGLWCYHPPLRVLGMTGGMLASGRLRAEPRAPPPIPAGCRPAQVAGGPGKLLSKVSMIILCHPNPSCPTMPQSHGPSFRASSCQALCLKACIQVVPPGWNARCPTPIHTHSRLTCLRGDGIKKFSCT